MAEPAGPHPSAEQTWRRALRMPCPRCATGVRGCELCGGTGDPVAFALLRAFRMGQRDVLERLRLVEDARRAAIAEANLRGRPDAAELRRRLVGP